MANETYRSWRASRSLEIRSTLVDSSNVSMHPEQRFLRTEAEREAGTYAFDFTPPRKGLYFLYVESPSTSPAIKIPTVLKLEVKETSR